jgi:hypothetical protein
MGPTILFDKSFLQSFSIDESVWFDHFFLANICPLFDIETLADPNKSMQERHTHEQEVSLIADKFPEMHGVLSVNHTRLCINNLLGGKVPMTGQIPLAGGRIVKSNGKTNAVFEQSQEAQAFSRWQMQEFMEIERRYAQVWRASLTTLDLNEIAEKFRMFGITDKSCKTLKDARTMAESVVSNWDNPKNLMKLAFLLLDIPQQHRQSILERWENSNYPPLSEYAPYGAHVFRVEVFFQIALAANLISCDRRSNRVDIAYLFYLPFCMIFVSSDRLHEKCASLFLRDNQEFVWSPTMKNGLSQLNDYYSQMHNNIIEKGVMTFATDPPKDGDYFVTQMYDKHIPKWRGKEETSCVETTINDSKFVEKIKKIGEESAIPSSEIDFDPTNTDSLLIKRSVRRMKGSLHQAPKDLKNLEE